MPCLIKMHGSLRSGVSGAKERLGPSCSVWLYLTCSKLQTGLKKVVPLGIP